MISIGCPDRDPPSGFYHFPPEQKLKLTFFDYICEVKDYTEMRALPYCPSHQDINQVINFTAQKIKPLVEVNPTVLIHCEVGISRSPAIAQIVLQELGLTEDEAYKMVMAERPQAFPNGLILDLYRRAIA